MFLRTGLATKGSLTAGVCEGFLERKLCALGPKAAMPAGVVTVLSLGDNILGTFYTLGL
jgi:hypothetical protein